MFGPVWSVEAGCYYQAALSLPHSKPLYELRLSLRDSTKFPMADDDLDADMNN